MLSPSVKRGSVSDKAAATASTRAAIRANSDDLLRYFEYRVRNREDAADLLSETFLQAWRRNDRLPTDAEQQRMWLFTIAAHVLANQRRSLRRRTAAVEALRSQLRDAAVADESDRFAVRDAVLRLKDAQRELVMLIHWDGFTMVEAAELLGLNASTARSRYAAARECLRRALTDAATPCT